jgi:hypothetical protein
MGRLASVGIADHRQSLTALRVNLDELRRRGAVDAVEGRRKDISATPCVSQAFPSRCVAPGRARHGTAYSLPLRRSLIRRPTGARYSDVFLGTGCRSPDPAQLASDTQSFHPQRRTDRCSIQLDEEPNVDLHRGSVHSGPATLPKLDSLRTCAACPGGT